MMKYAKDLGEKIKPLEVMRERSVTLAKIWSTSRCNKSTKMYFPPKLCQGCRITGGKGAGVWRVFRGVGGLGGWFEREGGGFRRSIGGRLGVIGTRRTSRTSHICDIPYFCLNVSFFGLNSVFLDKYSVFLNKYSVFLTRAFRIFGRVIGTKRRGVSARRISLVA